VDSRAVQANQRSWFGFALNQALAIAGLLPNVPCRMNIAPLWRFNVIQETFYFLVGLSRIKS